MNIFFFILGNTVSAARVFRRHQRETHPRCANPHRRGAVSPRVSAPVSLCRQGSEDDEYDPEEDAMSHQDLDATREEMRRADVEHGREYTYI